MKTVAIKATAEKKEIKLRWALFVTYIIIQSITSSEMCSLHLTHPSAHTHLEQWAADAAAPGSSWGFGALLKGLTSVVDNSCRSRESNPQPRVTSPTIYPLGHDCPYCWTVVCLRATQRCFVSEQIHIFWTNRVSQLIQWPIPNDRQLTRFWMNQPFEWIGWMNE